MSVPPPHPGLPTSRVTHTHAAVPLPATRGAPLTPQCLHGHGGLALLSESLHASVLVPGGPTLLTRSQASILLTVEPEQPWPLSHLLQVHPSWGSRAPPPRGPVPKPPAPPVGAAHGASGPFRLLHSLGHLIILHWHPVTPCLCRRDPSKPRRAHRLPAPSSPRLGRQAHMLHVPAAPVAPLPLGGLLPPARTAEPDLSLPLLTPSPPGLLHVQVTCCLFGGGGAADHTLKKSQNVCFMLGGPRRTAHVASLRGSPPPPAPGGSRWMRVL